ncbi:MAG: choice-of-anchor F family protein [Desulfuromonadaceae bacterium]|nr:choice-of-anchor F family protein [Desulfuromonadaceae bacterium]
MRFNKMKFNIISVFLALALMAAPALAGIITSVPSATGASGFGGLKLDNGDVVLNGSGSWFDELTGDYFFSPDSDFTYTTDIYDGTGTIMAYTLAKDWPVGEPSGIKIVNDDFGVKEPKPMNCIMSTSYLDGHYLDSADPKQVVCSSPYQTHKRYKLAMLPSTVDGVGSESVDLVFNVESEAGSRDYQVFQKINNWTDGRLKGFTVQVGFGVGEEFTTVAEAGVALEDLNISVPSDVWSAEQLALFSAGLFGPTDKHSGEVGFFDPAKRAGFLIDEYVVGEQPLTDILHATQTLGSDYAEVPAGGAVVNQFGPWLASNMLPYGIFFDDDGNPDTDADLLAWYGYDPKIATYGWMGGSQHPNGAFATISDEEIYAMAENLSYTMDEIDDLVNVGLNYVVTIGDVATFPGSTFTIRVTPTADTSGIGMPGYVGMEPYPLLQFGKSDAAVLLEPKDTFTIGSMLTARVGDADLNLDPYVAEELVISISTDSGLFGTLTLVEQGEDRGVFAAALPDEYSNVPVGTVVTMTYEDLETGSGDAVIKTSSTMAIEAPIVILSDANIDDFEYPETIENGKTERLILTIQNAASAEDAATGTVLITGTDGTVFTGDFADLAPHQKTKFTFRWKAQLDNPTVAETVAWLATIEVNNVVVDEITATTQVTVKPNNKKK